MSGTPDAQSTFAKALDEHLDVARATEAHLPVLTAIAAVMVACLHAGGKILWCGNGGSAAEAQHLAAELVVRFTRHRRGMPSIALTTDSSILTAAANDYGFETVFARQVQALGRPGDVLVGMSTSGNSPNVVAALQAARAQGLITVAFTGQAGSNLAPLADHLFSVPSSITARIQEMHSLAGHMLCDCIELDCVQAVASEAAP